MVVEVQLLGEREKKNLWRLWRKSAKFELLWQVSFMILYMKFLESTAD